MQRLENLDMLNFRILRSRKCLVKKRNKKNLLAPASILDVEVLTSSKKIPTCFFTPRKVCGIGEPPGGGWLGPYRNGFLQAPIDPMIGPTAGVSCRFC